MAIEKNSANLATIGLLAASAIVLATTLLPALSSSSVAAAAAVPQTSSVSKTFTLKGNNLDQLKEQARQQVNSMQMSPEAKAQALETINISLERHFSASAAGISISCTITITYPPLMITITCRFSSA